jgi:3'(2'), 5'-bisphosphate nucleotidase
MNYEKELHAALEAVAHATQAVGRQYAEFQAIPDAPADIATAADREAQEIILQHLHRLFPGDAFCAEEQTPTLAATPRLGPRQWVVDPIDGSRGFARKNGEFAVMVGFVDQGQVGVGVIGEPARERLTYAVRGGGCWRKDGTDAKPVRCRVSDVKHLSQAAVTQSRSRDPGVPTGHVKALAPARVVETYSAGIKLALVARGEVELYVNTYLAFHDWDICAGHILVEEAGGRVTGLAGEVLRYGLEGAWQKSGLLASNAHLHPAALEVIASARASGLITVR